MVKNLRTRRLPFVFQIERERRECGGSRLERHFAGLDVESVVRDGNRGNRGDTQTAKFDFHADILPNTAPAGNTQSGTIGADETFGRPHYLSGLPLLPQNPHIHVPEESASDVR